MVHIIKIDDNKYDVNGKTVTPNDYTILKDNERKAFIKYLLAVADMNISKSIY